MNIIISFLPIIVILILIRVVFKLYPKIMIMNGFKRNSKRQGIRIRGGTKRKTKAFNPTKRKYL